MMLLSPRMVEKDSEEPSSPSKSFFPPFPGAPVEGVPSQRAHNHGLRPFFEFAYGSIGPSHPFHIMIYSVIGTCEQTVCRFAIRLVAHCMMCGYSACFFGKREMRAPFYHSLTTRPRTAQRLEIRSIQRMNAPRWR
jgi:hypothetical protein